MSSTQQKLYITAISAGLFLIISSPFMYKLTNKLGLKTSNASGCPTTLGLIIHSLLFALIVYLLMLIPNKK